MRIHSKKKLYVIPHFLSPSELELPFWEMDLESFEIIERWDVNDDFKRKLDVSNELCILSTSYFDNSIWFVIHKSDKICRLNLESGETDVYDAHVENICSISVDSECIWLSQEDGSIIQWDIQEGIVHKYNNEVGETRGSAVSRVLEAGNKIISVPAYAEYISVKDEGDLKGDFKAKRELQINIIFKNMVTFGKYINHTDRYILCPYNVNGLYEMLKKNGEIKYRPFEQQIYFSDFKVRESYLNKILAKRINENQEYKIEDFCQDIMSLSGKEKSNIREDIIGDKIYKVL